MIISLLLIKQFLAHHRVLSSWQQQQQQHMHAVHTQAVLAHAVNDQAISAQVGLSSPHQTAANIKQQTESGCGASSRPHVALLMVILGHQNATRHGQYWLAVANRRAYALQHGFPLYLVNEQLGSGQHAAWEKLIAVQAVFQHSCADWVWMSDADAYVMTLERNILDLAQNPQTYHHPKHVCSSDRPDIIAASACITHINTGSMLWRNSNFTRQFITDAWHSKFIARPAGWWDQAAILHMYKVGRLVWCSRTCTVCKANRLATSLIWGQAATLHVHDEVRLRWGMLCHSHCNIQLFGTLYPKVTTQQMPLHACAAPALFMGLPAAVRTTTTVNASSPSTLLVSLSAGEQEQGPFLHCQARGHKRIPHRQCLQ